MNGEAGRLPVGHQVAGRYQVARFIGSGEMGEVYDVRDITTGYAYALKLLAAELGQNTDGWAVLRRDAEKAASLNIDAVAKSYDFQTEPTLGVPYVLGEYVTYPSLTTIVSSQGPMGLAEFDGILNVLAIALDALHQAGIVHRALKPSNIFANPADATTWQVRVTDFGIGAARPFAPPAPGWTATPGWLSAEQADPATPPTAQMDVYALGLIAFYALTGRSPYLACRTDPPDLNMLWAEMTAPLPTASQRARELGASLSPTLDPWFARALAVSPNQRFQSVGEMRQQFASLLGSPQHVATMRPSAGAAAAVPSPPAIPEPVVQQPIQQAAPVQPDPAAGMMGDPNAMAQQGMPAAPPYQPSDSDIVLPKKKSGAMILIPIAVGGALALVALLAFGGWFLFGRTSDASVAAANAAASASAAAAAASASAEAAAATDAAAGDNAAVDAAAPEDAAVEAEAPKDALVTFACDPECAEIWCDNKRISDVKEGVRLTGGKHTCLGKNPGYIPAKDTFEVKPGEDAKRELKLRKIVATGPGPAATKKTCGTFLNPCK